jgi:ATP-binding cassette subfamily F protein 3
MFLHALAEKLIVFKDSGVSVVEGGYNRFLESNGWEEEPDAADRPISVEPTAAAEPGAKLNRKELRRKRSDILARRAKAIKPIEKKITAAEGDIEAREKEMARLNETLLTASQSGRGSEIAQLSQRLHACQAVIDRRFDELERLMAEHDALSERFDCEVKALGESEG